MGTPVYAQDVSHDISISFDEPSAPALIGADETIDSQQDNQVSLTTPLANPVGFASNQDSIIGGEHAITRNRGFWWDTAAQWAMALFAFAGVGLSGWAVWLLKETLVATRAAAASTTLTYDAFVAVERGRVLVSFVALEHGSEHLMHVIVKVANIGRSHSVMTEAVVRDWYEGDVSLESRHVRRLDMFLKAGEEVEICLRNAFDPSQSIGLKICGVDISVPYTSAGIEFDDNKFSVSFSKKNIVNYIRVN